MSLSLYNKKRNFSDTPEPEGKIKSSKNALCFVVQKHDASQLHYDFRLEMNGTLKSWAIPKGPSLNPADKRLARLVEDHPYDYRTFEGVIPDGNYGGGTVMLWDEGTYEPANSEGKSKKEQEEELLKELEKGSISIRLHGKKIKGLYTLFRLKNDEEGKSWLLVKKGDEFASKQEVSEQDKSVKSGKTLEEIAEEAGAKLNSRKNGKYKTPAASVKADSKKSVSKGALSKLPGKNKKGVNETSLPKEIKPMLATLVNEPFTDKEWLFEIKWDGYRALAHCSNGGVELISRNGKPFTKKYGTIADSLSALGVQAVFDGEIVAIDKNGLAKFQSLQNWQNTPVQLQFYIFDIIWLADKDLTTLPLIERKGILQKLLPQNDPVLKYSDHVEENGNDFFKVALEQGLEGIMAKKKNSIYQIGSRSHDWVKIKVNQRQEVIIAGFTEPRNSRQFFGALLLGVYQKGQLIYIGHTGSGFTRKSLEEVWNKLQPLIIDNCPFAECPKGNMPTTWVAPELVCEIKFTEWTKDWIARHPIFMGLREDKKAKEVLIEKSKTIAAMLKNEKGEKRDKESKKEEEQGKEKVPSGKKTEGNPLAIQLKEETGQERELEINGYSLKLTNLNKLYWKKEGGTKRDLVNYYLQMAPYLLPYLVNRPQSLHRYPNGIDAPSFFQKDMKGKLPEWIQTHQDFSESTGKTIEYLVCSNEASLVYMANLGCIEMHPWHSRVASWQFPDWCLIDLDPEGIGFDKVIECAQVVKKVLDSIGVHSYPKTSGSTGIHIYIPLGAKYSFEQSKLLAELVVNMVNKEIPSFTSVERNPEKRKRKVYLDFLQNKETQTAASPYSLRPKRGMPVSAPLHWEEVKKGLTPHAFTMNTIHDRLKREGDLFKPVLGKGIDLDNVLKKLQALTV